MLKIIIIVFLATILLYLMHFVVINIGNLKTNKYEQKSKKKNFFAIVIAARNEENVIENLINSLKRQNYPKNKYEIYVITNNCNDDTAGVSKRAGAKVIECKEKVKSKGEVLTYTFNKLNDNKKIDAYVIFDADNVVDNNFLTEMNKTVNEGYNVSQGFRDVKNINDSWISCSYAFLYYIENLFINRARHKLNKSVFLNGTGVMITKKFIDNYGYNPKTLTEDIELTAICALKDETISFNETAIFYDEQVADFKTSLTQRKRWSFGTVECLKFYYKDLLKKLFKDRSYSCLDVLMFTMATFLHVLSGFTILLIIINTILNFDTLNITKILVVTLILYIIGILIRIYLLKKYNKSIKENIGGILLFDLFVLSWVPINFICLFLDKCNWDSIKHNRNIKIEKT